MTQKYDIVGISSEELLNLSSMIVECSEKNNALLNQIIDLIDSTSKFFECDAGREYRKVIDKISYNRESLNNNFTTYCKEISFMLNSFQSLDDELSANINNNS